MTVEAVADWSATPAEELARKSQAFFAQLQAETVKPHFGGHAKELILALLLRAEEAGLYNPRATP